MSSNIVNDFIKRRNLNPESNQLGKLAIIQSNYFDLSSIKIKQATFETKLGTKELNLAYKKAIKSISLDLSPLELLQEKILHQRLINNLIDAANYIFDSKLLAQSLAINLVVFSLLSIYLITKTTLAPDLSLMLISYPVSLLLSLMFNLISFIRPKI